MFSRNLMLFAVSLLLASALQDASVRAEYTVGYKWMRRSDYDRGKSLEATSEGNPCTDAEGNGVWLHESTEG
jgi:hypothetical protein